MYASLHSVSTRAARFGSAVLHEGQGFDKTPVSGIGGAVFENLFGDTAVEGIVEVDDACCGQCGAGTPGLGEHSVLTVPLKRHVGGVRLGKKELVAVGVVSLRLAVEGGVLIG